MYIIERFGALTLPIYNTVWPLEPVPTRLAVVDTIAGAYDNDGGGRRRYIFPHPLPYQGLVAEDVYNNNRATLDALRAAVGTRNKLYRRAQNDNAVQWCIASLVAEPHTWPYAQKGYFVLEFQFQQQTHWTGAERGFGWILDSGIFLDASRVLDEVPAQALTSNPQTLTATNGGNLMTYDVLLEITAAGTPITALTITGDGWQLVWAGTLLVGGTLTIDSGAWSVTNNGVNDYNALTRGPAHAREHWIELETGVNTYTVARTGGSAASTAALIYYDRWA